MLNNQKFNSIDIPQNCIENSFWNSKLEKSIQSLGELCIGYKWMHCELAKEKTLIYNRLMYCSIFFAPIPGVLNTINAYISDQVVIPIIITIISFMTGVLISIIKFGNYESQINKYKSTAGKYTSLANNARVQLNLGKEDREDAKQYIVWFTTSYSDLFEESPIIPEYIMLRYRKHAEKNKFSIPGEVGILTDGSILESKEKELQELYNLDNKKTVKEVLYKTNENQIRLNMFGIGKYSIKNFKKTDLARFNNIVMKRKMNTPRSGNNSSNTTDRSTYRSTGQSTYRSTGQSTYRLTDRSHEDLGTVPIKSNKYTWKDNFPKINEEESMDQESMV